MPRTRKCIGAGLVLGLLLGAATAVPASSAPAAIAPGPTVSPASAPAPTTGAGRPVTVTLLTGDRVTVTGGTAVSVRPGPGRAGMTFVTRRTGDHISVLPRDAVHLVRSGRVDQRLFDVTELVSAGYDDARRDTLPLLLRYRSGADRKAPVAGTRVTRDLPAIGGAAVQATKDRAAAVWTALTTGTAGNRVDTAGGVDRIWLDGRRRVVLDRSVAQIGAPEAHRDGWTGRGVRVAVLDTGVDATHPDLAGRVAESRNFSETTDGDDTVGHGTHVASIIAGSGAAAGGRYRGVAPDATLLSGKVCESDFCTESAILAGMQWATVEQRAAVVNLSLGGQDTPQVDPLEEAVGTLTAQTGALFVIAAGNDGSDASVGSPGSADAALTVGAVDRADDLADFSSRGPRPYDEGIKPDLTAPGVGIVAARAAKGRIGDPVGDRHVSLSGTSMATPHVAGAVAILAQQRPDADAGQLKALLMASARAHPEQTVFAQGAGRVDVAAAVDQRITSDPPSVSFGRTTWPHHDDTPVARTVAYRNTGSSPVTLHLTTEVTGPDGEPAPAGMFRLGADRVTVPAGGRTEVTVTADTSVDGPDGYHTGRLVARSDAGTVATPLAVHREVESYQLTVEILDGAGARANDHFTQLYGLDQRYAQELHGAGEVSSVRVPKGRYGLASAIFADDPRGFAVLAQPELTLDRDTRITVDARRTGPVRMTVPETSAVPALVDVTVHFTADHGSYGFGVGGDDFTGVWTGRVGGSTSAERFVSSVSSQWVHGEAEVSPYLYALSETFGGTVPTGFVRDYHRRDLAAVHQRFHGDPAVEADRVVFPRQEGVSFASAVGLPTDLPGSRVEYLNAAAGLRWWSLLETGERTDHGWLENGTTHFSEPVAYRAGRSHRDEWNGAPFGPALPRSTMGIARYGDTLVVDVPVHADAHGHGGYSVTDTERTVLYRDGKLVGESPYAGSGMFVVPPEPAEYRLEVSAARGFTDLSTEVVASWTFRSAHVPGDAPVGQPAMAVRFAPRLDEAGTAPAGRLWTIPVTVDRQPGAPAATVTALTVDVSYDGGDSWQPTRLRKQGTGWVATVRHPSGPGWVSLRASATGSDGSLVTQRIIQAYRLG
ncbi:peptidase S8 [Micromonospora echinospora]|uniref:Subtilase family protein n=1 Tax=Micromonospora echinospora TaxID=1877 RepID=A0A1C4XGY1_MICEC|nr:S8 family serine peptidase [Micromonospora echinospora]OZV82409.1 peptidase S8 [Micromonospora echinospora]SCF07592.1 Subtilase family protein [Micromonospora echinospora]